MAKFLEPVFASEFKKRYSKLEVDKKRKFTKQLKFLINNYKHPSLKTRKMAGINRFEARLDRHFRFTFEIENNKIILRTIGSHDEGLGKK